MFSLFAAWFPGGATSSQPYLWLFPGPSTEPDKRISHTSGSSVNYSDGLKPTLLSVSGQCSSILTLCIVSMFPLSRAIDRGDLRSAGIGRLIAKPLRLYWSPSLASASFGRLLLRWSTILGYYRFDSQCFTKNLWVLPMLAWLLRCRCLTRCCLRPREDGQELVLNAPAMLPAP